MTDAYGLTDLTHRGIMRTNIDIDDALLEEAFRVSGERTTRAVVERALRLLIQTQGQGAMRSLRGAIAWDSDLAASRQGRRFAQ